MDNGAPHYATPAPVRPMTPPPSPDADDEIDLREVYELLRSGRWVILAFVLVALFLGVCYVMLAPRTFQVGGLVQVDQNQNGSGGVSAALGSLGSLLSGATLVTDAEIQIIQSRLVLDPVIDELHLLVSAQPDYFPIIGHAVARWNHDAQAPAAAPPLLGRYAWGGESITVGQFKVPEAAYDRAYTLVVLGGGAYRLVDADGNAVLSGKVGTPASTRDGAVQLLVTQLVARPGEAFHVIRHARQSVLKTLGAQLSVSEQGKQSGVIGISYRAHDKQLAKRIVDAIENSYIAQNINRNSKQSEQSLSFLEKQLPALHTKLDTAQKKLATYQRTHGAADVASETQLLLKQSVALETQRSQLVQQRDQALQRFTAHHPVIRGLDRQIATIEAHEARLQKKIAQLPHTQQEVLGLMRELDVNTQLYTTMLDAIQQFQVTKAGTVGDVRIVDYGMLPLKPVSPKKGLTLILAIVLGGFCGVAWLFLRRVLLRGVDDPQAIERATGLNVLASIPYANAQRRLTRAVQRGEHGSHVLAVQERDNATVEAMRSLRTALHFVMLEAPNKLLMFTGPAPRIGKSFVAANFGAVLAAAGKRVVVVGMDLRKGRLHEYFSGQASPGVADFIGGDATLEQVVQRTGIENLDFVARGTHSANPSELLMHDDVKRLFDALSAEYDQVIVDTPPVLAVTDAAIVGGHAGTTLLVLKSAEHPMREIDECIKRLADSGVRVRGVLMNQVGAKAGSYGYGNYGYSYYHYGK